MLQQGLVAQNCHGVFDVAAEDLTCKERFDLRDRPQNERRVIKGVRLKLEFAASNPNRQEKVFD